MKAYTVNTKSKYKVGQVIKFRRADGAIVTDTVRRCFWQHALLAPYAANKIFPALVLTNHSWCAESDVVS
jgi:hypothetical protein